MFAHRAAAIILITAAACQTAEAGPDTAATVNAAFARGKAEGKAPEGHLEAMRCAALWYGWWEISLDTFTPEELAGFDAALSVSNAAAASQYWESVATGAATGGMVEAPPGLDKAAELGIAEAQIAGAGLREGKYDLIESLGACAMPAAE